MTVKYNICSKTLLPQCISAPVFYSDLFHKFKRIAGKPSLSDHFKKILKRYKTVGYNMDIMRQSECLLVYPIKNFSNGFLLNCMAVGQASGSMIF